MSPRIRPSTFASSRWKRVSTMSNFSSTLSKRASAATAFTEVVADIKAILSDGKPLHCANPEVLE